MEMELNRFKLQKLIFNSELEWNRVFNTYLSSYSGRNDTIPQIIVIFVKIFQQHECNSTRIFIIFTKHTDTMFELVAKESKLHEIIRKFL